MAYSYIKAIHIIFIVTWFAGLFYIVRLFVYFSEAHILPEPQKSILINQYQLMQKRLWYGITWPSAIITACMGTWLIILLGTIPGWLWIKLSMVILLYGYHFYCHYIFHKQQQGFPYKNAMFFRIWNEVATVLLVGIIFIVVLKNAISMLWGIFGLAIFSVFMMAAIFIYKKIRENAPKT